MTATECGELEQQMAMQTIVIAATQNDAKVHIRTICIKVQLRIPYSSQVATKAIHNIAFLLYMCTSRLRNCYSLSVEGGGTALAEAHAEAGTPANSSE
eukprot:11220445-Karenia_brevis.AAC.1